MSADVREPPPLTSPIRPDWTVCGLLNWIAADDGRCHDARLDDLLDAIDRALGAVPAGVGSTVVLVRSLALRVAEVPTLGELRLGDIVTGADDEGTAEAADRLLVAV